MVELVESNLEVEAEEGVEDSLGVGLTGMFISLSKVLKITTSSSSMKANVMKKVNDMVSVGLFYPTGISTTVNIKTAIDMTKALTSSRMDIDTLDNGNVA